MNFLVLLVMCFLTVIQSSQAGVSDAQRRIIDNQLFLLKEGMVSEKEVFKKAKKFDDTGIFGIGSDEMTREEYKEYLREKNFSIKDVKENEKLESVEIKGDDGEIKTFKTDFILGFFGLIMQLGPILEWGLNIDKKLIPVNTENFETDKKGIFAIGDICFYPGKLKLILSGFHEGALAARGCFKYSRPNEKYKLEFTTTSKSVKNRLGIKE